MVIAILVCSDGTCGAAYEALGELEELEARLCECGCALQAVGFCEAEELRPRVPVAIELSRAA